MRGFRKSVLGFQDTYILVPLDNITVLPNLRKRGSNHKRISDDFRVEWAEEQHSKSRQKRDFVYPESPTMDPKNLRETTQDPSDIPRERVKRIDSVKRQKRHIFSAFGVDTTFNDELWNQQWYLKDTRTRLDLPKLDLNVLPVYRSGISGKNVRISILDDGIEYTHEDLQPNYDPKISYDCNEDDFDPLPRYDVAKGNSHGTRCAGEVAMVANNEKCGVGIAFNAKIGGVKMLDGLVTDRIEGTALGYALDKVDIYSASWGPNDDGKTVDGPGRMAKEAIERGVTKGRNGKGAIYVWASGNGGSKGDNCNCDGYLTSPYTISIGSASQKGEFPWYGEVCASNLAVTYSSGTYQDQMIATTDLKNSCTIKHTGTSASAPLAAGIIALALEVNPSLTWRDVQHLIVWTSELSPLAENPGWQKNAAGLWFSTKFGFGLMNAMGLVSAAYNWTNVPQSSKCVAKFDKIENATISPKNPGIISVLTAGCQGTENEVVFLEHVEVKTTLKYPVRGALEIYLTSPSGTKVQILAPRKNDDSTDGFKNWSFMSVMTWGELASGLWTLEVSDSASLEGVNRNGEIGESFLILHGTKKPPAHMFQGPRNYNENYNRIHNRVQNNYKTLENNEVENFLNTFY